MKSAVAGLGLALLLCQAHAADRWEFESRIPVSTPAGVVYHHLDGAGRKHIAVSAESVALAWEDNRARTPQIYVTLKSLDAPGFAQALRVSTGSEAYEPAIAAIGANRYLLAFEQDGAVYARVLSAQGLADSARLSQAPASHASVAAFGNRVFVSWRERDAAGWFIKVAALRFDDANRVIVGSVRPIEAAGLDGPVLFPAIAANAAGLCVAWEDRRAGHTRLLVSHAAYASDFSEPRALNEFFSERNEYDRGNGVTRVSLASFGQDEILAAWMDKRRSGAGHGIFAALGAGAGEIFSPDEKVHGEKGDRQPHYNPATAGNRGGDFVVAWDDFRRGDSDIWISAYNDGLEWSRDYAPGVASGAGEQSHASIALDEQGDLHLLWIERDRVNGPSRLWYSLGQAR